MSASLTLKEYKQLVEKLVKERGFDDESVFEVFLLLVEEIGELGKAIRKSSGVKVSDHSKSHSVADELADVLWYVLDLSNMLGVDLDEAFANKELKNQKMNFKKVSE